MPFFLETLAQTDLHKHFVDKILIEKDGEKFKSLCHPDKLKLLCLVKSRFKSLEPKCERCGTLSQSWVWEPGDEISCKERNCGWKGTPELSSEYYSRLPIEDWWDPSSVEKKENFYVFALRSDKLAHVEKTDLLIMKKGNYQRRIRI